MCMVPILPTGSFHSRSLIAYMVGDVTRARVFSHLPSARNPFMDFATLRAQKWYQSVVLCRHYLVSNVTSCLCGWVLVWLDLGSAFVLHGPVCNLAVLFER